MHSVNIIAPPKILSIVTRRLQIEVSVFRMIKRISVGYNVGDFLCIVLPYGPPDIDAQVADVYKRS